MQIKLLKPGYKSSKELYNCFLDGSIKDEFFTENSIELNECPDFPIYMAWSKDKVSDFKEAVDIISKYYITSSKSHHFDEVFWHSLFITKSEYILDKYPEIKEDFNNFRNIVIKNFDWESYVFKSVFLAELLDENVEDGDEIDIVKFAVDNGDLFNYLLKYKIFVNKQFFIRIFSVIKKNNLEKLFKSKMNKKGDFRVLRGVFGELNNRYPVIMSPLMDKISLEKAILDILEEFKIKKYIEI